MTKPVCSILHISDLHMGSEGDLESELDFLATDLTQQLPADLAALRGSSAPEEPEVLDTPPDLCVVSGDITNTGCEYQEADKFLGGLATRLFGGRRDKVVLVPGNHDIYWPASKDAYQRAEFSREAHAMCGDPLSPWRCFADGQENVLFRRNDDLYPSRLRRFVEFYETFYGDTKRFSLTPSRDFTINVISPKVVVVGFNSCSYVDHLNAIPTIDQQTIFRAAEAIQKEASLHKDAIRLAVWHHGMEPGGRSQDYLSQNVIEALALNSFSLALHGHLHDAQHRRADSALGWTIPVIGAGSLRAGASARAESVPRQYNLVVVAESQVVVYSRRRRDTTSPWMSDPGWESGGSRGWERTDSWVRVAKLLRRRQTGARRTLTDAAVRQGGVAKTAAAIVTETARGEVDDKVRRSARAVIGRAKGVGLEDVRFLFGRIYSLRTVLDALINQGANTCVEGPQWVGKTSFLQALCDPRVRAWVKDEISRNLDDGGVHWCYIDLRDHKREADVVNAVTTAALAALGSSGRAGDLTDSLRLLVDRKERLILALDHFEALLQRDEFESPFLNYLRAWSGHALNVVYSMRTEAMVPRIGREKAYYFNAAGATALEFLEEGAARAMIETSLTLAGYEVAPGAVEGLLRLGGGHPYFLALARQRYARAWDRLATPDVNTALEAATLDFDREVQNQYDGLLDRLNSSDLRRLRSILLNEKKSAHVPRELFPIVDVKQVPFSEHLRQYCLSYYLPRREEELAGRM